ncbi:MAG: PorV/PorQ family protein [bacterium]
MELRRLEVKKLRSSELRKLIISQIPKYLMTFVSILFFFPVCMFADAGETGASFLNLGVGAHELAMGGAVTALSTGVSSLYWNPGGLGWLNGTQATLMHAEHFQSIRYEHLAFAYGTKAFGTGFSMKGLYLGELEERTVPSQNPISTFGAYFVVPSFTFAKYISRGISLGTNIKLIYQKIGVDNAISYAGDIGMSIRSGLPGLKAGIALTNVGTKINFTNSSFSLPTQIRTGLGYTLFKEKASFGLDLIKPLKDDIQFCFGAEGLLMEKISLRAGYRSGFGNDEGLAGLTAGLGLRIENFNIDYAFATYGALGLTHNFSLSYNFGKKKEISENEERKIAEELQRRARMTAEAFYQQGLVQQGKNAYDEALRSFDVALIWDPYHEKAAQATEEVRKKLEKREVNEHLSTGIAEYNHGRYLEAISEFGLVLEIDPNYELAKQWFNAASSALVKVQMVRIEHEQEIQDKISLHFKNGLEYYSRKKFSSAISEWNAILVLDPIHQEAREYIGKARLHQKEQVLEILKNVTAYIDQSKWIEALHEVNRALAIEPGNQVALTKGDDIKKNLRNLSVEYTQKGIKLYKEGKFGLAETELKMAMTYDNNNITAKEYLDEISAKEKGVSGKDINDLYMKGVAAYTQEKYQLAVFYWKRVLEIDPKHANAARNIQRAEEKVKLYKK